MTDPVEPNDNWVLSGNGLHFLTACCGTAPTAGSNYIHIQNSGGRVASTSFAGLSLAAGTYTVRFDIGSFINASMASIDSVGLTADGLVLTASSQTKPTPNQGEVVTWTLTYEVPQGHVDLGDDLGFSLVAPNTGVSQNASFDNLRIDFVAAPSTAHLPEPGTVALVALALGTAAWRRRPLAAPGRERAP